MAVYAVRVFHGEPPFRSSVKTMSAADVRGWG
jgi:hypothetical protein